MSTPPDKLLLQRTGEQMAAEPANCQLYDKMVSGRAIDTLRRVGNLSAGEAQHALLTIVDPIHLPNCPQLQEPQLQENDKRTN